jgi:serine/threonine protein kinase
VSQSIEQLIEAILTLSDSEKLRLLKSLTNTLTLQGLQPREGIALDGGFAGNEAVSNSERSTEKDPSAALDPSETALETTSTGTEPIGEPGSYESGSQTSDEILETVHHYKILRLLSQGGMGRVYVARDIDLGRDVALKQVIGDFAKHPEFRTRFSFEATALANLEHPGVVGVYGQGRDRQGRPFFVMRLAKGEVLSSEIKRFHAGDNWRPKERLLELRRLLNTFMVVCNVVAYAHSRGVLHRDIKPSNVIVGKYGETFLVDWGLAKVLFLPDVQHDQMEVPSAFHPDDFHGMTQFGAMVGTLAYMSPEQASGRNDLLEPATDIYSLGATLYEILIGRPPFGGAKSSEIIKNVVQGTFPKPRDIASDLPSALEAVCLKAMALRPEDRYASASALADDVERWLAGAPVSAHRGKEGRSFWPSSPLLNRWWNRKQKNPAASIDSTIIRET